MNPNNSQTISQFAQDYADAWCSQDPALVASFFDENGSLKVNSDPPAVGREAITEVALGFMSAFPDMRVSLDDLKFENEATIFHWTLTGTNTGPGGTGRSIKISGFEVWNLGPGNLIIESRGHFDAADYVRQLEG